MLFVQRESQGVCKAVRKTCTDFCGNHRRKNAEIEVFLHFFAKILAYVKKKQYLCSRFREEELFPMRLGEASRRGEEEQRSALFAQQIC